MGSPKRIVIAASLTLVANPALALKGFSTCHAAGTTVTSISGFDTPAARMTSVTTFHDALEACHRDQGLKGAALKACADKLMRANSGPVTVRTNCGNGTLTVEYSPIPGSVYYRSPGSRHVETYTLPLDPTCGGDNLAAINSFKTLCPSYEGRIEANE